MSVILVTGEKRQALISNYRAAREQMQQVVEIVDGYDNTSKDDKDLQLGNVILAGVKRPEKMRLTAQKLGSAESNDLQLTAELKRHSLFGDTLTETWQFQETPERVLCEHGKLGLSKLGTTRYVEDKLNGILTEIDLRGQQTSTRLAELPLLPQKITDIYLQRTGLVESSCLTVLSPLAMNDLEPGESRKIDKPSQKFFEYRGEDQLALKQLTFRNGLQLEQSEAGRVILRNGDKVQDLHGFDLYLPEAGPVASTREVEKSGGFYLEELVENGWAVLQSEFSTVAVNPKDGTVVQWMNDRRSSGYGSVKCDSVTIRPDGELSGKEHKTRQSGQHLMPSIDNSTWSQQPLYSVHQSEAKDVQWNSSGHIIWKSSDGEQVEIRPVVLPQDFVG